jgi:hypothetical protein
MLRTDAGNTCARPGVLGEGGGTLLEEPSVRLAPRAPTCLLALLTAAQDCLARYTTSASITLSLRRRRRLQEMGNRLVLGEADTC